MKQIIHSPLKSFLTGIIFFILFVLSVVTPFLPNSLGAVFLLISVFLALWSVIRLIYGFFSSKSKDDHRDRQHDAIPAKSLLISIGVLMILVVMSAVIYKDELKEYDTKVTPSESQSERAGQVSEAAVDEGEEFFKNHFRPATKADVIGKWKQIGFIRFNPRLNPEHPYIKGPVYYRFDEDNTLIQLIVESTGDVEQKDDNWLSLFWLDKTPNKHRYEFEPGENGEMGFGKFYEQTGKIYPIRIVVAKNKIPTGQGQPLKAGDLALYKYSEDNKPEITRLLTRISEEGSQQKAGAENNIR